MSKGFKIAVTFPAETLDFLQIVCKRLTKVPIIDPTTKKPVVHPQTGNFLYMSNTGGIEELIHGSILAATLPLLYHHEAFTDITPQLEKFREQYGNYLTAMIQKHIDSQHQQQGVKTPNVPTKPRKR
jgi:hypothetical protein